MIGKVCKVYWSATAAGVVGSGLYSLYCVGWFIVPVAAVVGVGLILVSDRVG